MSSKPVIQWTNKFGRGMSYDEVLVLAMEHSKDQIHKSFTYSIIQQFQFITFVWDNNDINPESLKGLSFHRTNGIIIQLSADTFNQPEQSLSTTTEKKYFQVIQTSYANRILNEQTTQNCYCGIMRN
jgi:hypothetical protein